MSLTRAIVLSVLGAVFWLTPSSSLMAESLQVKGVEGPWSWSAANEEQADAFLADSKDLMNAWEQLGWERLPMRSGSLAVVIASFDRSENLVGDTGGNLLLMDAELSRLERLRFLSEALILRYQHWMGGKADPTRIQWVQNLWVWHAMYPGVHLSPWPREIPSRIPRLSDILSGGMTDAMQWSVCLDEFIASANPGNQEQEHFVRKALIEGVDSGDIAALFTRYDPVLNAAEVELLWQASCVDACLRQMDGAFLSVSRSKEQLEHVCRVVGIHEGKMSYLDFDEIFLKRNDPDIRRQLEWILSRLPFLLEKWHPYYFNSGISLGRLYECILEGDLEGYRENLRLFQEDCRAAESLSLDTETLIKQYDHP